MDFTSWHHAAAHINIIPILGKHHENATGKVSCRRLLNISEATIDRLVM